jgi:hypothetical protein
VHHRGVHHHLHGGALRFGASAEGRDLVDQALDAARVDQDGRQARQIRVQRGGGGGPRVGPGERAPRGLSAGVEGAVVDLGVGLEAGAAACFGPS